MRASPSRLIGGACLATLLLVSCSGGATPGWTAPPGQAGGAAIAGGAATAVPATGAPGPGSRSSTSAPASIGPATSCDTSNLPGWPTPGQVTTTGQIPVIATSQLTAGRSRFLFTVTDDQNRPIAAPDLRADLAVYDLCADPAAPTLTLTAPFTWGIEGLRGYYVAYPTFGHAGTWGAAIVFTQADGSKGGGKLQFSVRETGTTPAIGAPTPSVRTPTLADVAGEVRRISTDTSPNPDFYRTSVDAALAAGEPFVLVFATPAFCTSSQCGPTLQLIKDVAAEGPRITIINVEPYQVTFDGTRLRLILDANGNIQPVPAAEAYGLPTEPWVFVVDGRGRVVGSFEAVVSRDELTAAIATALGQ